jgi:hypothetical protein
MIKRDPLTPDQLASMTVEELRKSYFGRSLFKGFRFEPKNKDLLVHLFCGLTEYPLQDFYLLSQRGQKVLVNEAVKDTWKRGQFSTNDILSNILHDLEALDAERIRRQDESRN